MASYNFPISICPISNESLITSYNFKPMNNEISLACGMYQIKRPKRSVKIYEIDISMMDIKDSYATQIKKFFDAIQFSSFFNFTIESNIFDVRFKNFKIENSNLHNRKNITFSLIGSHANNIIFSLIGYPT